MESSHAIRSRRHVAGGSGCGPGARLRHSPDGAQPRDNRRRRCEPTRGNETLCPRVVRSTRCDRWAVSQPVAVACCYASLKYAGQVDRIVYAHAPRIKPS
jgi:hypothetical protein